MSRTSSSVRPSLVRPVPGAAPRVPALSLAAMMLAINMGSTQAMAEQKVERRIPAPGGEVVLVTPLDVRLYETYRFPGVRRAGDWIYLSGMIIGRPEDAPADLETYKSQTRRMFERMGEQLRAVGADFADVVKITSFHVWEGPDLPAPRMEQFQAFNAVKDEFMKDPLPAWTAVGTTGLLAPRGITEVEMIAYAPQPR